MPSSLGLTVQKSCEESFLGVAWVRVFGQRALHLVFEFERALLVFQFAFSMLDFKLVGKDGTLPVPFWSRGLVAADGSFEERMLCLAKKVKSLKYLKFLYFFVFGLSRFVRKFW